MLLVMSGVFRYINMIKEDADGFTAGCVDGGGGGDDDYIFNIVCGY